MLPKHSWEIIVLSSMKSYGYCQNTKIKKFCISQRQEKSAPNKASRGLQGGSSLCFLCIWRQVMMWWWLWWSVMMQMVISRGSRVSEGISPLETLAHHGHAALFSHTFQVLLHIAGEASKPLLHFCTSARACFLCMGLYCKAFKTQRI